jgi:ketosteroid isomerase-like protein
MRIVATTVAALVVLAVQAVPALSDELADLKAARAQLDEAFVNQDADTILSLMTADHIAVSQAYGGAITRDEQVKSLPDLKVTFSNISEPQITMFGNEAAFVTYEESLHGTFRGKPLPGRVFASEIWVKMDGKWLEKVYQETVIDSDSP